jgi:hypothetical protein
MSSRSTSLIAAVVGVWALVFVSVAGAATPPPDASYTFPKQAKKIDVSLVTAFDQCTSPTLMHRPSLALPACAPVQTSAADPTNVLSWQLDANGKPKGKADIKIGPKGKDDLKVKFNGKGIYDNGAPHTGYVTANANLRVTDNGCSPSGASPWNDDCTMVDIPFPLTTPCTAGVCKTATGNQTVIPEPGLQQYEQTNIEIHTIYVTDPDGDQAFRQGFFVY